MGPDRTVNQADRVASRFGCHPHTDFGAFANKVAKFGHVAQAARQCLGLQSLVACAAAKALGKPPACTYLWSAKGDLHGTPQ